MFDKAIFQLDRAVPSAVAIALLSAFYALSTVLLAYFLSQAIVGIWQGLPISDEIGNISCFALFFICRSVAACLQDLISERFANRNVSKLRHALFASIFSCGFGLIQAKGSAAMINDCKGGLEDVKVYLSQVFLRVIDLFSIPLALCLAIMGFDAISGCIVLVSFPLIIVFMRLIGMNAASEAEKRYRGFARMSNYFLDAIRGMNAIRSFGRQKEYGKSVYRTSERYRKLTMKTIAIATLSSAVLDLFATLSLAAVAIMLGVRLIDGSIGFAPALATLILVPEFFRPIKRYASDYHASLNGRSALASIHGTIEDAKHLRSKHIGRMGSMRGASDLNISTSSTLKAQNIAFSYGDGFDLRGISFKIPMNAKIAIVGSSGSGKTTLLNLLSGFSDPDSGEFEISGTRVATLGIDAWKKHVAYIPQEPYIFSMSLRANIAFYNRDATDEEILSAIEKVGLGGLLKDLPCGLDTIVGDGGVGMSGGQAQRVALARALLDKERFIWIFDEPTSHLDLETEYEIKQKMLVLMEDKFVLFATHRLHWLDQMDYAIKVDNGRADLVKLEKDAPSPIDVGRSFEDVS